MRIKYRLTFHKIGDRWVGFATGADAKVFPSMVRLNSTGYEIYSMLNEGLSEEEIIVRLKEKYASGPFEEEVSKLIDILSEEGVIEK